MRELRSGTAWRGILFVSLMSLAVLAGAADKLKPFVLASNGPGDFANTISEVRDALKGAGFQVAGEYSPYADTHVIVITNRLLRKLAGEQDGGAYLAGQRVSVVRQGSRIQVAYSNPDYLAAAYRVKGDVSSVAAKLKEALGAQEQFGAKNGLTTSKLARYHYAFGMEYFDDQMTLAKYDDQAQALRSVEKALDAKKGGTSEVYRIDSLDGKVTVLGVAMTDGYSSDEKIMSIIDVGDQLKQAAHLPYEMVVRNGEVQALAPRFRIAIDFPDQNMIGEHSFMSIMNSPQAIEKALTLAAGGSWSEAPSSRGGFNF